MTENLFSLHFGLLFRSKRLCAKYIDNSAFIMPDNTLLIHILANEECNDKCIEGKLINVIKEKDFRSWLYVMFRMASGPLMATLLLGTIVLIMLGILHTFEESFFEFTKSILGNKYHYSYDLMLPISFSLLLLLLVYYPSTFKVEEVDPRKKISEWLSGEKRTAARMRLLIKFLIFKGFVKHVQIWNAGSLRQGILNAIIDCTINSGVPITIYFSYLEKQSVSDKLMKSYSSFSTGYHANRYYRISSKSVIDGSDISYRFSLMSNVDRQMMSLMSACTIEVASDKILVSVSLLRSIVKYTNLFNLDVDSQVDDFIDRCSADFGLAYWSANNLVTTNQIMDEIRKCDNVAESMDGSNSLLDRIAEDKLAIQNLDGSGCIILAQHITNDTRRYHNIKHVFFIVETAIDAINKSEEYYLTTYVSDLIRILTKRSMHNRSGSTLVRMSPKALDGLLIIYERSGDFASALSVANILTVINPDKYNVKACRILERLGKYHEALKIIRGIKQDSIDQATVTLENKVAYYIEYSWILVNVKQDGSNNLVRTLLQQAYHGIKLLKNESHEISLFIWRYWNIWYNLYEWEEEYDAAMKCLMRCLNVPGLDIKWLSGTHVNLGIAYRNIWKYEDPRKEILNTALLYGRKGLHFKIRSGDYDEIPISVYHLCISMLVFAKAYMLNSRSYIKQCLSLALYALLTLDRVGSEKKKRDLESLVTDLSSMVDNVDVKSSRKMAEELLRALNGDFTLWHLEKPHWY